MAGIKDLLDYADEGLVEEATAPLIKKLERDAKERSFRELPKIVAREKAAIDQKYGDSAIEATAKDIAMLDADSERLKREQGIKQGSNLYLARAMYIRGSAPREIAKETGIPTKELNRLINRKIDGWKHQKDRIFESMGVELYKQNLPVLRKIHGVGLAIIEKSLDNRLKEAEDPAHPDPISLAEAQTVANILAFVSKEKRLDEAGALKEAEKNLTPTEILEGFADDPYFGPKVRKIINASQPIEVVVSGSEDRNPEHTQNTDG